MPMMLPMSAPYQPPTLAPILTDPTSIPGLKLWLDASKPVYTSAWAQCVDGDTVTYWPDSALQDGGSNFATAVVGTTLFKSSGINSKPALLFSGSSRLKCGGFLTDVSLTSGFTVFIASAPNGAQSSTQVLLTFNTSSGGFISHEYGNGKVGATIGGVASAVPQQLWTSPIGIDCMRWDGSQMGYLYDCLGMANRSSTCATWMTTTASGSPTGLTGDLYIGAFNDGGLGLSGYISEILIWPTPLTNEQCRQVYDYLAAKRAIHSKTLILCTGNSLTSGTGSTSGATQNIATTGDNYPSYLWNALGGPSVCDVRVNAFPGRMMTNIAANTGVWADMLLMRASRKSCVEVVWELTNQLNGARGAWMACYNQMVAYHKSRRALGWKTVAVTNIPQGSGAIYTGYNADVLSYNALVRANWPSFSDGIIDLASDARLQTTTNTSYFYSDQTHLTSPGYAVVAGIAQAAVTPFI